MSKWKWLSAVLLAVTLSVGLVSAQEPAAPTPTVQSNVQNLWDSLLEGNTNWLFEAHALYAPELQRKWGGGVGAFYPLSQYVYFGVRVDWVDGGFWMPSGSAGLQAPIRPFKFLPALVLTPFGYAGIGIPLSGATVGDWDVPGSVRNNNGRATAILGYGVAVSLWKSADNSRGLSLIADREKWSGFPGNQYRFGLAYRLSF